MVYVGTSVRRVEDPVLLRGSGTFAADVRRPGMLHAAVLRSPVAHAEILGIDLSGALSMPDVIDAVSFSDISGVQPIPMRLAHHPELTRALQYPLADDKVRYVGEPVAVVVARNRYLAEDALAMIDVEYEPLDVVVDSDRAIAEDAPTLHDAVPGNVVLRFSQEAGDIESAASSADRVIEAVFYIQRHTGIPMETRGLVAEFDERTETMTVWGAAKVIHFNRGLLSRLIGIPMERIRLVETEVGGGFGVRGEFYPEDFLIPYLARRLRRPVAWIEDRAEHLRATNHSREQTHHIQVGVRATGEIIWLWDRVTNDMGGYVRTHGATVPTMTAAYLPGPYLIPNYRCEVTCVLTNKTPTGTYRAPGRFEAAFVRERAMDLIASELGLDPVEVRLRNFVPAAAMPYDTGLKAHGTPVIYDSGDYAAHFRRALDEFGYREANQRAEEMRQAGRAVGVGIGWFVEKTGLGPWEYARVEIDESGDATVFSGLSNVGQGVLTNLSQIVADGLALDIGAVRVVLGDTSLVPYGHGSFASRGAVMAGNASMAAAAKTLAKLKDAAAKLLECSVEDLVLEDGVVSVTGTPETRLSYREVAEALTPSNAVKIGMEPGLREETFFYTDQMVYPFGAHIAMLEVDRETGYLDIMKYLITYDVGRAVNPMLINGQLVGGFAQGLGGAVFEELRYDEAGQLLSGTFVDYLIPTAAEMPPISTLITEDAPSPMNPMGLKGAGEGGTVAVGATLANAVAQALGGQANPTRLPLSPEYVRSLVVEASQAESGKR